MGQCSCGSDKNPLFYENFPVRGCRDPCRYGVPCHDTTDIIDLEYKTCTRDRLPEATVFLSYPIRRVVWLRNVFPSTHSYVSQNDVVEVEGDLTSSVHLVLNMDVNKTIIMSDKVSGKTSKDVVNEALANVSWGVEVSGEWELRSITPSSKRPECCDENKILSYSEWVERRNPGSKNKKARQALTTRFTDTGHPGERLRPRADQAMKELKMPDGSDVVIVPSFFELLLRLKEAKRSFTLCFRTFGEDLGDVAKEMKRFCEGLHPLFPNACMDGSDGHADYRFSISDPETCGTFHRDDDCTSLIMGTVEQPGEGRYKDASDRTLSFFDSFPDVHVVSGCDAVQDYLMSKCAKSGTLGIRDYFQYWKSKGMTEEGGKPFFFDVARSTNRHEMFFDDNIHYSHCYIVQPVDVREPSRKHWVVPLLDTHLVRAEPWDAIYDRMYFINHVARLEAAYQRKLAVRDRLKKSLRAICRQRAALSKMMPATTPTTHCDSEYDAWHGKRRSDYEFSQAGESISAEATSQDF